MLSLSRLVASGQTLQRSRHLIQCSQRIDYRMFSKKVEQEPFQEKQEQEKFQHDPKKDKKEQEETGGYEEEEFDEKKFKTHRKALFLLGKTLKYTIWATMGIFFYHFMLLKKMKNPEQAMLVSEPFLDAAKFVNWSIYDFKNLMTKPQMTKMLPDRPNIPGYAHPKTLVMNMNGTLVHQSYKLGVGVEVFKRPGLSTFLTKMSRQYELVVFGLGESGTINEICEALDPKYEMIQGRYGRENTLLKDGKYIKDLSYLNRPLKDVVYLDLTDESVIYHKDNCILLPNFEGDLQDRELIDLIPFLDRKYKFLT